MSSHLITVLAYALIAALLVAVELVARFGTARVPTLGSLLRGALRHRAAQFGLLLAWWWIGWHFFVG
ncbi:DUF6186 family protein [Nakamurella lactea]|uniref:DUF6186 family protein n=1 Tax=Nakamurella lactea TaxID=459515 RepID=UPI0004296090|nr:DUF6186 family protein [Nakamurella lactea]